MVIQPRVLSRELRATYGFEEVAIVPGDVTTNPDLSVTTLRLGPFQFTAPILASAMDAIVDPNFAGLMAKAGALGVMNLEGVYCRYEEPYGPLSEISSAPKEQATEALQRVYAEPLKEELVGRRVEEIKAMGAVCAVSITPQNTKRLAPLAVEAGADIVVVQSTVTTARHISNSYHGLRFSELIPLVDVPVVVGNCVTTSAALELMEQGIDGLLVGVGPGAACTTREVTGVGVPQVTATLDCAAARDEYFARSGKYVPVITDGGIRTGGDLCKAIAAGADGVMIGTPLAQTFEAPGKGFNWGMASPHPALPRGTRVNVGAQASLQQVLFGPSQRTDGTHNLVGALRICMSMVGAQTIEEFHERVELVVAPSIATEGKSFQRAGLI
ncbi:MAG: GuaB3 family IMP dehydrogenase-related protein [Dehalococcoidia bacterium]|nr:GuaB3 family IMP dehydrogenase-related protein [Dehalococcoidia bacterium]